MDKPIAILPAWRGVLYDPATGQPHAEAVRRRLNDEANKLLKANIRRRGLSFYPVVGAGQEQDAQGNWTANRENSYIVQPVGDNMDEDTFLNHVRKAKIPLTIFLVNGVKLQGVVTWFDNFCVLLRRDGHSQLVYKHAISTIMPGHPIQLFEGAEEAPAGEKV